MSKKLLGFMFVLVIGAFSFGAVAAQDATQTVAPNVQYSISEIVDNKDQYYGQEVITEGVITDLINIRAFVLSDGNTGGSELLVINASDSNFDLAIKNDQRVRLTGTLYPDFNDGGWDQIAGMDTVNGASPVMESTVNPLATEDMMMLTATPSMMATTDTMMMTPTAEMMTNGDQMMMGSIDLSQMYIPENLRDHTILVLTSLDTITYIQE